MFGNIIFISYLKYFPHLSIVRINYDTIKMFMTKN